jgi:hypothetical protein
LARSAATVGVVLAVAIAVTPPAGAAENPWEVLGGVKQAWREWKGEAGFALKLVRKTVKPQIVQWRTSKGSYCPWRHTSWAGYCENGSVTSIGRIDLWLKGEKLGSVPPFTKMSAGCRTGRGYVRVLWPVGHVPWYWVKMANVLGGTSLRFC